MAGGVGGHVGDDRVRLPAEHGFQAIRRVLLQKIHHCEFDARDVLDLQQVDADDAPLTLFGFHFLRRDLRPAAGRRAEVEHAHAGLQQVIAIVHLDQLVGRARAPALAFRARHIRVIELAFQPQCGGERALARRLHARLERAAARLLVLAAGTLPASRQTCVSPARSARISSSNMPSRRPRSAIRMRGAGKARRMASRIAQPASTRSARSWPMQPLAARW